MDMKRLFHLACAILYVGVCIADYFIADPRFLPVPGNRFSKFVWLTLIDLYLQTFYHLASVLVAKSRGSPQFFDTIGHTLVGPVGATVVILFWALFLFDPDTLLADDNAKAIIAIAWYNHGIHTLPIVTNLLEILFWRRQIPKRATAMVIIFIFAVLYVADIHFVYYTSGFWAYPILGFLALHYRILFIFVCMGILFVNYTALSWIHDTVHGSTGHGKAQKKRN